MSGIGEYEALSSALLEAELRFVDIGARGDAPGALRRLAAAVRYCAFEPDADEAARLEQQLRRSAIWRSVTIVPKALSPSPGPVELYMTQHPGFSSTLAPSQAVAGRYCRAEVFALRGSVEVPAITLEDAAREFDFDDACFLKLDTQGTEVEILRSGEGILEGSVLGLYVEILLQPFYQGQAPIGGVFDFLLSRGFSLVDLQRTFLRRAGHDPSVFSRRQVVWAHALFMREPADDRVIGSLTGLTRYVGITLAFEQFDLALEALSTARAADMIDTTRLDALEVDVRRFVAERTSQVVEAVSGTREARDVLSCARKDSRIGLQ